VLPSLEKCSFQNQDTGDDSPQKRTAQCIGKRRGYVDLKRERVLHGTLTPAGCIECEQSNKNAGAQMGLARAISAGQRGFHWGS
jgi:hypothetical protein